MTLTTGYSEYFYICKMKITGLITNRTDLSGKYRRFWLLAFLVSVLGTVDIPGSLILPDLLRGWAVCLCISCLKATAITAVLWWMRRLRKKVLTAAFYLLFSLYALLCIFNSVAYGLYGIGITIRLLNVLSQTNASEAMEFIPGLAANLLHAAVSAKVLAGAAAVAAMFIAVRYIPARAFVCAAALGSLLGFGALAWAALGLPQGRNTFSTCVRFAKAVVQNRREMAEIERFNARLVPFADADKVESDHSADIVMVIGESASKKHMSLYGYPLATTPFSDAMRDSLFVFEDALGSSITTADNMEKILSFLNDSDTDRKWYDVPLLIDLFNAAGYRTFWISNQEQSGLYGNATTAMSSNADVIKYVGALSSEDFIMARYDEAVMPWFHSALSAGGDTPIFMAMHLMGSHIRFSNRYPAGFARFSGADVENAVDKPWLTDASADIVAAYDNSICYTDSLMHCMIQELAAKSRPAALVYFSDHGENVYDTHNFMGRDRSVAEVPFVIYLNRAFRDANPALTARMAGVLDRPFSTASVIHSLMTLTGTSYPLYDSSRDVLSPEFTIRERYVEGEVWE